MLEHVRLQNFRSFTDREFTLDKRTVILGDNGTGKSTVIEAIRVLSINKSFRTSRFDEAIEFERPFFRVTGELTGKKKTKLEFFYGQQFNEQPIKERMMSVSGKPIGLMEYVGTFPTVLFVPSDIEIVTATPQHRRHYIDGILWQVNQEFRRWYIDLNRVLKERSSILFLIKINRAGLDELAPWNELLSNLTQKIRTLRRGYTSFVNEQLARADTQSETGLSFGADYQVEVEDINEVTQQEVKSAQNFFGPHRDDIEITINGRSARRFASRGQARTGVVLLKSIESQYLKEQLGIAPTILLDDLFSELDKKNSQFLFNRLGDDSQVIATAISPQPLLSNWKEVQL